MKFIVEIREDVEPKNDFVIVSFQTDKTKQHFQINCSFNPYYLKMKKWEVWEFNIKFRAEEFEESKTKVKSYFTHFDCDKATMIKKISDKN